MQEDTNKELEKIKGRLQIIERTRLICNTQKELGEIVGYALTSGNGLARKGGDSLFMKDAIFRELAYVTKEKMNLDIELEEVLDVYEEVDELMEVSPEIIALDATEALRPGGVTLDEFFMQIKHKYPEQLLMADCSTAEEALHADEIGFDFIGTTLVGYTPQSRGHRIEENDFEILRKIIEKSTHRVIAEGNINTPQKARRVIELGAFSVVVGSVITRPQMITRTFVDELE